MSLPDPYQSAWITKVNVFLTSIIDSYVANKIRFKITLLLISMSLKKLLLSCMSGQTKSFDDGSAEQCY